MRPSVFVTVAIRVAGAMAVLASGNPARAAGSDGVARCIQTAEEGQRLRLKGRLVEAQKLLATCAREACPSAVRDDCRTFLADVTANVPTFVLRAQDSRGRDLTDIRVSVDGVAVTERTDGRAFSLDPGVHTVVFDHLGGGSSREVVVARAGEKNRPLSVVFAQPIPVADRSETPRSTTPTPRPFDVIPPDRRAPVPTAAWVLYAFGLAGLGSFAVLGAMGYTDARSLEASCSPKCDPGRVSEVRTKLLVADVAGVAGLAATGVATYLVLSRPRISARVGPSIGTSPIGTFGLVLKGSF